LTGLYGLFFDDWYLVAQAKHFVGRQKVHGSAGSPTSAPNMELREANAFYWFVQMPLVVGY